MRHNPSALTIFFYSVRTRENCRPGVHRKNKDLPIETIPTPMPRQLLLFMFTVLVVHAAQGEQPPGYSQAYSPLRDPFADGRAAIALASSTGRRVLIEVGGEWCTWCHVLDSLIRDHEDIRNTLRRHYVLLKVNVSDENANSAFMAGLPALAGYPKLYVADSDGTVIHAQDPAEFFQDGSYDARRFLVFLRRWSTASGTQALPVQPETTAAEPGSVGN